MSQALSQVVRFPGSAKVLVPEAPEEFEHRVWPYRLILPFLFLIGAYVQGKKLLYRLFGGPACVPKTNCWFIDGMSINSRRVKDGARGWRALDAVYNFRLGGEGPTWLARAVDDFWLQIRNAQAVRNRLKIVKRELRKAILKCDQTGAIGEPIRILSLAAGSGQGVIEVVEELRAIGIECEVLLLDQDESALEHARVLAEAHNVTARVTTRKIDVVYFERGLQGFKPDIVEMCGLLDYLPWTLAVILVKKIHRHLKKDGFFLACHIHSNWEKYFLWHQENWGMLYRSRQQLREMLTKGYFLEADLYAEPHRIHSVSVAQKL
jgi:SAM-dependent methyltransferase